MSEAVLIQTGGTLSSTRNQQGLLTPTHNLLDALAAEIGYHNNSKPYTIDSIDFNITQHYPLLLETTRAILEAGNTPIVCGGTDSLAWYSTLLTHDLKRNGYFQVGSGQKIVFLSAMRTLHDAPELVRNILRAGLSLANDADYEGGLSVSAKSLDDYTLDVHDVTNQLDKISAELLDAFRSHAPIAHIKHGELRYNAKYEKPENVIADNGLAYACIAPSLLKGYTAPALLAYLTCFASADTPFDGLLIEGLPIRFTDHELEQLGHLIRTIHNCGMQITFCNPVRYSSEFGCMLPVTDTVIWDKTVAALRAAIQEFNVRFTTMLPKDEYIRMMLSIRPRTKNDRHNAATTTARHKFIGIRYVPNLEIMHSAISLLAPMAENMLFSSLPGGVMPSAMLPLLQQHTLTTRFWSMFDYEGSRYVDFNGRMFVESHKNLYAAGQDTASIVRPYKQG